MIFTRIQGVGVELEGADWPRGMSTLGWKEDGSVHMECLECDPCTCDAGEIASPVLNSWREVQRFVADFWPGAANDSCGLHVHVSVDAGDYGRLMEPAFHDAWSQAMRSVADDLGDDLFNSRLDGFNRFCSASFDPTNDIEGYTRYRQLNYAAWSDHGTLECRVFPMFEDGPDAALTAIGAYLECVESYLADYDSAHGVESWNCSVAIEGAF